MFGFDSISKFKENIFLVSFFLSGFSVFSNDGKTVEIQNSIYNFFVGKKFYEILRMFRCNKFCNYAIYIRTEKVIKMVKTK